MGLSMKEKRGRLRTIILAAVIGLFAVGGAAGCGKKGPPVPPPDKPVEKKESAAAVKFACGKHGKKNHTAGGQEPARV